MDGHQIVVAGMSAPIVCAPLNGTSRPHATPVEVPRREFDLSFGIFWMKNRDPQHWRDSQQLEHVLGKYIISNKPMSEEEWARERADVLDVEPRFVDGQHKAK
jgi:hypothetical protein